MGTLTDRFQLLKPDFGDAGAAWEDPVAQNFETIEDRLGDLGVNVMAAKYGAVGDNSHDDTDAFNAARADIPSTGGFVYAPPPPVKYKITASLDDYTAGQWLKGAGQTATLIRFTGTGYLATFGSLTDGALTYGCGASGLHINLDHNAGMGIRSAGCAMCQFENIYIEGQVGTNSSVGVMWDGGNAANIFGSARNIICNHIKYGHVMDQSGDGEVTSLNAFQCTALGDAIAGSRGWDIRAAVGGNPNNGSGSHIVGGNLEFCERGLQTNGVSMTWTGLRFEGNTWDVYWDTHARGNICIGFNGADTWGDEPSGFNQRIACAKADPSGQTPLISKFTGGLVIQYNTENGYIDLGETSIAIDNPAANYARLWARDNGSGKTQLCVRFASGATQVLATEP